MAVATLEVGCCRGVEVTVNVRESSFTMTRGGGDEDIEGGSKKIRGGGSGNLFTSKPTGGGGLLKN